jgi:hypothetical protein
MAIWTGAEIAEWFGDDMDDAREHMGYERAEAEAKMADNQIDAADAMIKMIAEGYDEDDVTKAVSEGVARVGRGYFTMDEFEAFKVGLVRWTE